MVRVMEKPEWFETVDAFEAKPSLDEATKAVSRFPRMAQRLVVIGAAAVFAAGGVAFAASTILGTANAVDPTPTASATPTATPTTPAPDPAVSPTSTSTPTATPVAGGLGTQPSIAGAGSGNDEEQGDNNQAGEDDQVGDDNGDNNGGDD